MLLPLLLTLPWAVVPILFLIRVRLPRTLEPAAAAHRRGSLPFVSVVIPARDEAHNIERVLTSLTASDYPGFELIVVDDRSSDGTGQLARRVRPRHADRVEVVDGEPLPEGWLGKPWACFQGAAHAAGELLLFTDADTEHGPDLLLRSVSALLRDRADALTVGGRQLMLSFWERLILPQVFALLILRFSDLRDPLPSHRWRDAVANGQYVLLRREVYEALGGHAAVRHEVVEDMRLAQLLVRGGWRLATRVAEDALTTRMYRSLAEIVRGWSKNIFVGALQSVPVRIRPFIPVLGLLTGVFTWLVPPTVLLYALVAGSNAGVLLWAALTTGGGVMFWAAVTARMGAPFYYGVLYPLGAAAGCAIYMRSWARGTRVEWKGREYRVEIGDE